MLGETAQRLLDEYQGDLRKFRDQAGHDVNEEQKRLQQLKEIGKVGADIFLREVQCIWPEVYPHADAHVTKTAKKTGLPDNATALSRLVDREDFPRLVAGLIRVELANAHDKVQQDAVR